MTKAAVDTRPGRLRRRYTVVVFLLLVSLDNAAIGLAPPLVSPISVDLGVAESSVGLVIASGYLVGAVSAVVWAYVGERVGRRRILLLGTLCWAAGTGAAGTAEDYLWFFLWQAGAAVGLGAVASIGFSMVSDLISPRRRGVLMSLFGLSQGVATLLGTLLGGVFGAGDWRRPFTLLALAGVVAAVAYLPTARIHRGQSEPDLAGLLASGREYRHSLDLAGVRCVLASRSNRWLVLQGIPAQVVFGSLVWLPRLFQAKAEQQGYPQETAIVVGTVFATLFQLGGVLSIAGGALGDRMQRRSLRGRALVAMAGVLAGIPLYVLLFFLPLRVHIAPGATPDDVIGAVLRSLLTEPTVAASFLAALCALALTSANSPNWLALIADVNLPEHRGLAYTTGNLANALGRSAGNGVVGVVFGMLARALPPPLNYAVGLATFQLFFIPTGIMFYLASRTAPADIQHVRATLRARTDDG